MFAIEPRAEAAAAGDTAKPAVSLMPRQAIRGRGAAGTGPAGSSFTRRRVQRAGRVAAVTPVPTPAAGVAGDWQRTQMKAESPQESMEEVFNLRLCTKDAFWVQTAQALVLMHLLITVFEFSTQDSFAL